MQTSLEPKMIQDVFEKLKVANLKWRSEYPGEALEHQPIHTLYGGAQLFKSDTCIKIGSLAVKHLNEFAPKWTDLADALGWDKEKPYIKNIYPRIVKKLNEQAVEDFRIDFEDGFGNRPDAEEDQVAEFTAKEVAKGMKSKTLAPFIGIRIKPFNEELKRRSARTLDIFISTLLTETKGQLPNHFIITLPKVNLPEQVSALVEFLEQLETHFRLKAGSLRIEIMIETTQAIVNTHGHVAIPEIYRAAKGRCRGAHFGTYDYTASADITAAYQKMDHPSCDFALHMMKVSLASRGVWLSDGATSVMPVPVHRGDDLTPAQVKENQQSVYAAWKLAYDHTQHSLKHGYYQGWDLHPGQLAIRYAACYAFFLEGLDQASARLKNFIEKAAQATLVGDIFDDAATGQGLLNYFLRAYTSGAISEADIEVTGLTVNEVRGRSFLKIVEGRRGK